MTKIIIVLISTFQFLCMAEGFSASSRDLLKVKNFARQAAEKANGGLSKYRPVASMYDNYDTSACAEQDNSLYASFWVCKVQGGAPAAVVVPTTETIVEVGRDESGKWNIEVVEIISLDDISGEAPRERDRSRDSSGELDVDLVKSIIADLEKVISKLEKFETDEGINSSHKNFKFLDGLRNGTFDVLDELDKVLYKKSSDLSAVKPLIEKLSLRFQYTIEKVYPDNRNFGKINRLFNETYSDYKSL